MSIKLKKLVKTLAGDDTSQSSRIVALEAAVGSKDTDSGSLKKRCKDIELSIGTFSDEIFDEDDPNSIIARIIALEQAIETSNTSSGEE